MNIRRIAAAAAFATGAALAFAPLAMADSTSDAASTIDSLLSGVPAAATPINLDISFDGYTIYDGMGTAVADTGTVGNGNYDLAIAYGADAHATALGGIGDYSLADGTNALANSGSLTAGATGFNYDTAEDIGNNPDAGTFDGAPDGAYAGGGSLIGGVDSGTTASSHDSAYDIGNNGLDPNDDAIANGGNSGAFAGDGQLIGLSGAGSGDTAYTSGALDGFGDGSAAVDGNNNFASSSGSETGFNEGSFSGLGNNNTAIADTNYTTSEDGVSATGGDSNYAYVFGPDNSTAVAGGTSTALGDPETVVGSNDISYVYDPFAGATATADTATSGGGFSNDLAEVLLTNGGGTATADTANLLYDIATAFGNFPGMF
jgi:hypothetical protein